MGITEEQRKARRERIGASDVPVILGLVLPYASAYTLWLEKQGRSVREVGEAADWGEELEPLILRHTGERLGLHIEPDQQDRMHRTHDWLVVHCDGRTDEEGQPPVEAKATASRPKAKQVREGVVPDDWEAQVQIQLEVLDAPHGYIGALLNGNELHVLRVERDPEFWAAVEPVLVRFYESMQSKHWDQAFDGSEATLTAVKAEYDLEDEFDILLPPSTAEWLMKWDLAGRAKKECEDIIRVCQANVLSALQGHRSGELEGYGVRRDKYSYGSVPSKVLRAQHPAIFEALAEPVNVDKLLLVKTPEEAEGDG